MESGKNNRNEEMLDDYIGYRLTTENSSQHSSFNLKGIVVAVLIVIGIAMIYDALRVDVLREHARVQGNRRQGPHGVDAFLRQQRDLAVPVSGDRKSTRLNSSHNVASRMPSSA